MYFIAERWAEPPSRWEESYGEWLVSWVYSGEHHADYDAAVDIARRLDRAYPHLEHAVRDVPDEMIKPTFPVADTRYRRSTKRQP